jgi:D-alanyl-D-alanine carboxypeptidase/D-alanyl-D-alanine-endopeptidase (penicillin-binding protein 4)
LFCSPEILPQTNYENIKLGIDSLLTTDYFTKTQIAVDVFDLTASQKVYSKNEKLLLRPASVQKIFTTGAALKFLGPDYTFKTGFYHTGEIEDSVCKGDIYIIGGFDPDFTNRNLDSIVNVIKEYGIKDVNGNLYADVSAGDSLFWGEGWMWDDDPGDFSPYLSPLCINDNSIKIIFRPGEIGKPAIAEVIPQNRFINVINNSLQSIRANQQ